MSKHEFFQLASQYSEALAKCDAILKQAERTIALNPYSDSRYLLAGLDEQSTPLRLECEAIWRQIQAQVEANSNPYLIKIFETHTRRLEKMRIDAERRWTHLSNRTPSDAINSARPPVHLQQLSQTFSQKEENLYQLHDRSAALRQISQDVDTLSHLFHDVDALVKQQDQKVTDIENQSVAVVDNTHLANRELAQAVTAGRSYRRLKWVCTIIGSLLVITAGVILGLFYGVYHRE